MERQKEPKIHLLNNHIKSVSLTLQIIHPFLIDKWGNLEKCILIRHEHHISASVRPQIIWV